MLIVEATGSGVEAGASKKVRSQTKSMACRSCGGEMTVHISTRNSPRHFECGLRDGVRAMQEMHNKQGPTYERHLAGMRAYVLTESYREPTDPPITTASNRNP